MFQTYTTNPLKSVMLRVFSTLAAALMMTMVLSSALAGGLGRVTVNSDPPGARIIVGSQVVGTTPATLELPAEQPVRIKLTKNGYKTRSVSLTPRDGKSTRVTVKLKTQ